MQTTNFRAGKIIARWAPFIFASVLFALFCTISTAQIAGTGSIQGTVTDSTGAVVPNAAVSLTDEATHVKRTTQTSGAGVYLFPSLQVGTYDLSAKAPGFKTYVQTHIVLEVGSSIAVNPALSVGTQSQEVTVQAEGLALQTEDSTYKQTIDSTEMTAMPLNGRHMTDLIMGAGGANTAPGGDFTGTKYSYQTVSISIAGGGGNTTLWRLDGGDNQDYMANGNLPYPFPDAVSQFSVESTALGAQDGGHVGGMVNVVTKSGTNQYHGEAFEFIRNNYLDATNFFSTSPDTLHQNQYGGDFGGPIKRSKMFAFAAYQRTEAKQSQSDTTKFVPTADNLKGDYSTTDGPNCEAKKTTVQLYDPTSSTLTPLVNDNYLDTPGFTNFTSANYNPQAMALYAYLPKPVPSVDTNNCGEVKYAIPSQNFDNQFVTRVDLTLGPKHNLYGRYFIDGYQAPAFWDPTNILVTTQSGNIERVQSFVLGDAYTFTSNLVNAAHISLLRRVDNRGYNASDINVSQLKPAVTLSQGGGPGIELSEGKFTVGGGTNSLSHFNDNALNISDDVTWVHGKHQFMFGGEIVRNQLNIGNAYESNGNFTFSGMYSGSGSTGSLGGQTLIGDQDLDFLMGTLSAFQQSKQQQNALRGPIPSLYIQDTYHASTRLTITGGLRWNPNLMPVDYFNRGLEFSHADFMSNTASTVYPSAPAGILYFGDKGVTREFTNNSPWQFSPNLGATFDPTGTGKTVIRVGGELAYDNPNFFTAQRNQQNPPYATAISNTQTSSSPPVSFSAPWSVGSITTSPFPQPVVPTAAQAQFFPQSQYIFMVPQFHAAYTIQWTLSLQHEFGRGWQAQLDYIGNATRHDPIGFGVSPAIFIPGEWGAGGTGCTGIVTTGPAAVKPGAAGTNCSTTTNQTSRFLLTIQNPNQGNQYGGGGSGSVVVSDTANASYNGMVATLQHRLSSTFSLLANWTWAKCLNIDDASGDYAGTSVEDVNNPGLDYGSCGSDYRNIENVSLVTKSAFHNHFDRAARLIVNDWEFAPLVHISSGSPFTVTAGVDNSLTDVGNDRPNLVAGVNPYHEVAFRRTVSEANSEYLNPNAFAQVTAPCPVDSKKNLLPGCQYLGTYGNISKNSFHGPRSLQFDAQISRIFPIGERFNTTFRLEAFNVLNHPDFSNPSGNLSSSTFGEVSSTSNQARVFQGSIKLNF